MKLIWMLILETLLAPSLFSLTLDEAFLLSKTKNAEFLNQSLSVSATLEQQNIIANRFKPQLTLRSFYDHLGDFQEGTDGSKYGATISLDQAWYLDERRSQSMEVAAFETQSQKLQSQAAERQLYLTVSHQFFKILGLQDDLKELHKQQEILIRRISMISERTKIGRSKRSELLSAITQKLRIESEVVSQEAALDQARIELETLIGGDAASEMISPQDSSWKIDPTWSTKVANHPDIIGLQTKVSAAKLMMDLQKNMLWPEFSLNAHYLPVRGKPRAAYDVSLGLSMDWKLYDNDVNASEMRLEAIQVNQLENTLDYRLVTLTKRFQKLENQLNHINRELEKLTNAAAVARENYALIQAEYETGLVSNLETLRALDDLLQISRAHKSRMIAGQAAYHELKALIGAY